MPKIVDHDERRRHILDAFWRLVQRDGAHEISVRHVAAEAGMPKSSIGHYVGTMPQLLGLAVDDFVQANTDHIMRMDLFDLDVDKATEVLFTLVPVTPSRRRRSGVWLLLAFQAASDPEVAAVLQRLNNFVAEGLRDFLQVMQQREMLGQGRDIDSEARLLHAIIDGLALECMTDPSLRDESDVRGILRAYVVALGQPAAQLVR
jgi:AcrR family transcriptional regulator